MGSGPAVPPIRLLLPFLRLGATAFGGPAMVAYIRDLAVVKKQWLSRDEFEDGAALCQSIPGATAMQTAAYVGLRAGGPAGALVAFAAFGVPAFVLMLTLSAAYGAGRDLGPVLAVFRGLQAIVIAIIANAAIGFGRSFLKDRRDALLALVAAAFLALRSSPFLVIAGAAALAILLFRSIPLPAARAPAPAGEEPLARRLRWPLGVLLVVAGALAALFGLDRKLFDLATMMLRIDAFAFGGGFASIPLMVHEVVDVRGWLDGQALMDGIALGQITPGPIVITATFVGYQVGGLAGAIVGTAAIFSPSFVLVLLTVPYFDRLQRSVLFRRALRGVLASFVGLLAAMVLRFGVETRWTVPAALLAAAALAALRLRVDILWVVLVGAGLSAFLL